ncbi:hypothetical protein ACIQYZ_13535 [Rhodococcus erythropolis]
MKLTERQVVPLTSEDLAELRAAAESHGITPGLFARALVRHGLDNVADLADMVEAEKAEAAARVKAGAREAVAHRWGGK